MSAEPAWPELQAEALHGLAGDFVRAIDPYTEADQVATLINILAGFGNLVGPGPHASVLADQHPARIFAVLSGATSKGRKGLSWGLTKKLLGSLDDSWKTAGSLSSGEGLIWAVRDPVYQVKEKRKIVGQERVISDPGEADKRLFLCESEFATVLKMLERSGNILSGILRQAWDGTTLRPLTTGRNGNAPVTSTGAHISIVGHITVAELTRYLTETEMANGLANRFVFLLVKRSKLLPEMEHPPGSVLNPLIERLHKAFEFAKRVAEVRRDNAARQEWRLVYERLTEGKPGLFGAIIGRAEAQVLRLSVAYALLDCSPVIRPEHQRAALALWDHAEQSALIIFGDATGNPIADTIIRALRDVGEMDRTAINARFGGNQPASRMEAALALLAKARMAYQEQIKTEGRAREVWRAHSTKKTN